MNYEIIHLLFNIVKWPTLNERVSERERGKFVLYFPNQ